MTSGNIPYDMARTGNARVFKWHSTSQDDVAGNMQSMIPHSHILSTGEDSIPLHSRHALAKKIPKHRCQSFHNNTINTPNAMFHLKGLHHPQTYPPTHRATTTFMLQQGADGSKTFTTLVAMTLGPILRSLGPTASKDSITHSLVFLEDRSVWLTWYYKQPKPLKPSPNMHETMIFIPY